MSGHGPDAETYERAIAADLSPSICGYAGVFMFETQLVIRPTKFALESESFSMSTTNAGRA